jgi:hypothetical protein
MVSQISNEINPLGAPLEVESVENNPVRAGAQLFSDGGQFLHAAKGSNLRCRFQGRILGPENSLFIEDQPGPGIDPTGDPRRCGSAVSDHAWSSLDQAGPSNDHLIDSDDVVIQ